MNKIREYINRITKKQWIIAGGVFAILVIMTATGIIFYQYQKELRQAAKEQEENKPKEELALSHGDYCLPNVFFKDGKVSGFIDLGASGVADKYLDIADLISADSS